MFVVRCSSSVCLVSCWLFVVCCSVLVVRCLLTVVCCWSFVVSYLCVASSVVARCVLFVVG